MNETTVIRNGSSEDLLHTDAERSRLKSLAYRLLGTAADAEDAVQEAYLRWYKLTLQEREAVISPLSWQQTVVTHICLDKLKSAQSRREVYVGEWLPEPIPQGGAWPMMAPPSEPGDPVERLTRAHSVSMALMIVLDTMTPAERVSFILHDVFQYSFKEIAEIVGRTPQACRQLASSARKRINQGAGGHTSSAEHTRLNAAFRAAWTTGNIEALVAVLDKHVQAVTDGGGLVSASIEPLCGRDATIEFFLSAFSRQADLRIEETMVNGEPGLVGKVDDQTVAVISTRIKDGRINGVWVMRNPEKLNYWH